MNFPNAFSEVLKNLRVSKGLTQRDISVRTKITEARISDFERGLRMPSDEQIELLADALEVDADRLTEGTDWLSEQERSGLREAAARTRKRFQREYRYRPPRDRSMLVHLRKAMAQHRAAATALLGMIARRLDASTQLRLLAEMPAGSAIEALVHLALLAQGAVIVPVAPQSLGYRQHPVVDPQTRRAVGDCDVLAYDLNLDGMHCLLVPQVGLACRKATWVVDFLCCIQGKRGSQFWLTIEVDGDGHEYGKDAYRSDDLAMPIVRIHQSIVLGGNTANILAERLRAALPYGHLAA